MNQWRLVSLSYVCQIKPPKKESKEQLADTDLVSFVPMRDLGICDKNIELNEARPLGKVYGGYTYFADNDVLLAKITPCFENGKLGIAKGLTNGIGFGSSEYVVFRANDELDSEYLFYFLSQNSFREIGSKVMTGAVGHKRVPKDFIENFSLPLPPLPEQKRIVAILDEAFAGISLAVANAEKNRANARELFESYLNNIFTQKGDENLKQLSEITTDISDGDHSAPPKSPEGIPFITISNINKKTRLIDFTNTFKVPEEYFNNLKPNRKPRFGDVIYTVTGSYGIPVKVPQDVDFCFQRHIGLLRPQEGINSSWLYYALLSPLVFKQATNGATGTAQKTVSLKVLRSIRVPIMNMSEQKDAVEKLDKIWTETQNLERIYQQKLTALNELKQSILQKAFTGELTKGVKHV